MEIFTKVLTNIDVERRLSFPDRCLSALTPPSEVFPAIELSVKDDIGGLWYFRCIKRSGVVQKLVIVSGWIQFVQTRKLHSGDIVILYKDDDIFTGAHYKIEVKRSNSSVHNN